MLLIEQQDTILKLTLNRPEVKNALHPQLFVDLAEAIRKVPPHTRVIHLKGKGDFFCSGADLQWMQSSLQKDDSQNIQEALILDDLLETCKNVGVPIIATVQGGAFGGACGLLAACDIVIAEQNARFGFTEVLLGLIPAMIANVVLEKIGHSHMRSLFITGRKFSAEEALSMGLVHRVVEKENLEQESEKWIQDLLKVSPAAVAQMKKMISQLPLDELKRAEWLAKVRNSSEAQEGINAFLNKRAPNYRVAS